MDYKFPVELKYTSSHEWVRIEDSLAMVGITDYAQHQLGDIVFVELSEVGMVFEKDSHAGEIESVKAVGDLNMPLSGEIIEVNVSLKENPELVNSFPYGDGWMLKIRISHSNEIEELLSVDQYKDLVRSEE